METVTKKLLLLLLIPILATNTTIIDIYYVTIPTAFTTNPTYLKRITRA